MVALTTERRAFLWTVKPCVAPAAALSAGKKSTLKEILTLLKQAHNEGTARVYFGVDGKIIDNGDEVDKKNQIFISEIRGSKDGKYVTILITRGDPNVTNPALIEPPTNSLEYVKMKEAQSVGWSAHLVICLEEIPGTGLHNACFESIQRLSASIVISAFGRILEKSACKKEGYTFLQKKKKGKKYVSVENRYHPELRVNRLPSEKLNGDIEAGELRGLTINKTLKFYRGPGMESKIKSETQKISISFAKGLKDVKNLVTGILQQAAEDKYESVTFDVKNLPGGQTSAPTIDLTEQDAMEQLYVRAQRLTGFSNVLEQCYANICDEIEGKMIKIVESM